MSIIETHCHLDYLKKIEIEELIKLSDDLNIDRIITIAVEPNNFDSAYELAQKHKKVFYTQGIHPHDADQLSQSSLDIVEQRCCDPKMVAVGEIGLDYYYNNSPRDTQIKCFKAHLDLAIKMNKPVVIHSRDADDDMITILKEYAPRMNKKGVIHSFTSGEELAKTALELDFYLGFNGIITFKNAQDVRDKVALCPVEKILIETDSPFLSPVPNRGKENSPLNLPHILDKIAEIKNEPKSDIEAITYANALSLFFE